MPDARSLPELESKLQRAVERNAILIVTMRHLIRDLHRNGLASGHQAVSEWTKCFHPNCQSVRAAIDGNRVDPAIA